jgi:hypothetical protein
MLEKVEYMPSPNSTDYTMIRFKDGQTKIFDGICKNKFWVGRVNVIKYSKNNNEILEVIISESDSNPEKPEKE